MNPWSFYKVTASVGGTNSFHVTGRNPNGSLWVDSEDSLGGPSFGFNDSNVDPLESDGADSKARQKVLLEAKNQKVNLGQVYGERHQTVLLAQKTAERVIRTVVLLRKGNFGAAAGELGIKPSAKQRSAFAKRHRKNPQQATADGWLELQYGWRPLLQDVYGALEFVQDKWAKNPRQRVSKSASVEDTPFRAPSSEGYRTTVTTQKRKTSVKYVLYYTIPNEFLKTLSEAGVTNPAVVAWELLPWSFVVDWFLPIGNFIQTWDATAGLQFEKGVKTTVQEVFQSTSRVGGDFSFDGGRLTVKVQDNSWAEYHSVHIQRSPLGGFPSVAAPQFKNPVSAEHMANLIALLTSTFSRR